MDTTMDLPISIHDVDPQVLIPALKSHLPYSLPLLRRLQHSLAHPSPTAKYLVTASVLDAVGDLKPASDSNSVSASLFSRGSLPGDVGVTNTNTGVPTPWLAAWVDLHAGPETQVVVYSSLEREAPAPSGKKEEIEEANAIEKTVSTLDSASNNVRLNANGGVISPDPLDRVRAQLLALLSHIKNRLMPEYLQSLSPNQNLDDNLAPTSARDANTNRIGTSCTASSATDSRPPNPPGQGQGQPFRPSPRAFKIGHLHTGLFSVLTASGKYPPPSPPPLGQCQTHTHGFGAGASQPHGPQMVVPGLRVHRFDQPPYNKYLFRDQEFVIVDGDPDGDHDSGSDKNGDVTRHDGPRSRSTSGSAPAVTHESNSSQSQLPPGYRFSDRKGNSALLDRHYELICRRSAVFRTPKSLASFPGVAVYVDTPSSVLDTRRVNDDHDGHDSDAEGEEEKPIAWAFLSADGTLAVLHVEPEHRGKGLAEAASREVMRRGMREGGMFRAKGEKGWVHADVAPGNRASCRVMEKLGGVVGWTVTWTVVEFD